MSRDLLLEIGTEELPPRSLENLRLSLAEHLGKKIGELGLKFARVDSYATPRRLALLIADLDEQQADEDVDVLGPPVANAFDAEGKPTAAAAGFAKRCGCQVDELEQRDTDKGPRLAFVEHKAGAQTADLLPALVESSLAQLPIARWMRWGASRTEFVRPVHWILCLFGDKVLQEPILGIAPGNKTRGHRFHADREIAVPAPSEYLKVLREQGKVLADPGERRAVIRFGVEKLAKQLGGVASIEEGLLDEVNALVEFPVPLSGSFEDEFLEVPAEALISSMQSHQKYFPVVDSSGRLMPRFIFVCNIESKAPERVVQGNERVIRPRLADARFFYQLDREQPLSAFREKLQSILYQKQLGSLLDKSERIGELATYLAGELYGDAALVRRAAELCKCDLASEMVQEFDELQGVMGRYYALESGEDAEVADAILEHYLPRQAGDQLPQTQTGTCLALADRLDTLTGIFGIGQSPTGSKDPFGLRRSSLAVLRLIVENQIHLPLRPLVKRAAEAHQGLTLSVEETTDRVYHYLMDRLPAWFQDRDISIEQVRAVLNLDIDDLSDIASRVKAVKAFSKMEQSAALAAANKRVSNLLAKSEGSGSLELDVNKLEDSAEIALAEALDRLTTEVEPLLAERNYEAFLVAITALREPVDRVFDEVMIMVDDDALRSNRLALLAKLRQLFLRVADISELPSES